MGEKTKIEWTDSSWTPIRARNLETGKVGWHCEHATTGCEHCYAESMNLRLGTGLPFKPGHRKDVEIFLDEKMLTEPLRWKKPRMIFVCSMSDLFADFVEDQWIDKIFAVMALCPQHTFQVLTKRAERMRDYCNGADVRFRAEKQSRLIGTLPEAGLAYFTGTNAPLPNVWLGISAERQQEFDERWHYLRYTPAAVRFVSYEPALGPLNIGARKLDWLICGGESGREARPMHSRWPRDIRDQCIAAGVPFFFKRWGEWVPCPDDAQDWGRNWFLIDKSGDIDLPDGRVPMEEYGEFAARRVGKKAAGRLLDGVEHNGFPEPHA